MHYKKLELNLNCNLQICCSFAVVESSKLHFELEFSFSIIQHCILYKYSFNMTILNNITIRFRLRMVKSYFTNTSNFLFDYNFAFWKTIWCVLKFLYCFCVKIGLVRKLYFDLRHVCICLAIHAWKKDHFTSNCVDKNIFSDTKVPS